MDILFTEANVKLKSQHKAVEDLEVSDLFAYNGRSAFITMANFVGIQKGNKIKVLKSRKAMPKVIELKTKTK